MSDFMVPVPTSSGNKETPITNFVNGSRVLSDVLEPVPDGFKRQYRYLLLDIEEETHSVGRGKVGVMATFWLRLADKTGIQFLSSKISTYGEGDGEGVMVEMQAIRPRPGQAPRVESCSVSSTFAHAIAKVKGNADEVRYFLPRRLETNAKCRLIRQILGEPTAYNKATLVAKKGAFLAVCDVPDLADPAVRNLSIAQSLGIVGQLYSPPSGPQLAAPETTPQHSLPPQSELAADPSDHYEDLSDKTEGEEF